jgi:hypothetical protein
MKKLLNVVSTVSSGILLLVAATTLLLALPNVSGAALALSYVKKE